MFLYFSFSPLFFLSISAIAPLVSLLSSLIFSSLLFSSLFFSYFLFSSLLFSSLLLVFSILFSISLLLLFWGPKARLGVEMHTQMEPRGGPNDSQTSSGGVWGRLGSPGGLALFSSGAIGAGVGPFWSPRGGPGTLWGELWDPPWRLLDVSEDEFMSPNGVRIKVTPKD